MKKSSLFLGLSVRKSRMTLMVTASVLAHTVIIAVGSMWHPAPQTVVVDFVPPSFEPEPPGDPNPPATPPGASPTATNPPEAPEAVPIPPVLVDDSDVSTPAPTPRTVRMPTRPVRTATATPHTGSTGPQTAVAASTGFGNGSSAIGTGRAQISWKTPKPPYPNRALQMRLQGSTTVRVTTDASGNIAEVVIVKSAGNILLDSATQSYVRSNWKGPANSSHTTEFVYQMP